MLSKIFVQKFNELERYYIVDSMPLEVCKMQELAEVKYAKSKNTAFPIKVFVQVKYFYGYKLYAIGSINGVFQSFDVSHASVHDIHYLHQKYKRATT